MTYLNLITNKQQKHNKMKKVWGNNAWGNEVTEDDMIQCGNGFDTWITHVQYDYETAKWHREEDYHTGQIIGKYDE